MKSVKFLSIFIYYTSLNQCNANEILIFKACRGTQQHEEIQLGLLYGILTDPKMAPKVYITAMISCFIHQSIQGAETYIIDFYFQHYRDLTLVSRDGLTIVLTKTNQIIFEKWLKLLDSTRAQVG